MPLRRPLRNYNFAGRLLDLSPDRTWAHLAEYNSGLCGAKGELRRDSRDLQVRQNVRPRQAALQRLVSNVRVNLSSRDARMPQKSLDKANVHTSFNQQRSGGVAKHMRRN